jgi:hypothetical protein
MTLRKRDAQKKQYTILTDGILQNLNELIDTDIYFCLIEF